MKKILVILLFFIVFDVHASNIYISKRDKDTYSFVEDCDFLLYDSDGNLIDSWIQSSDVHISNVDNGSYSLVERPLSVGFFNSDLSKVYKLDVTGDDFEVTLFNNEIDTPDNLGSNNNYFSCVFFVLIGVMIVFYGKYGIV